jgi:hypothetical protein
MYRVEMRLRSAELCETMEAMRVWLDQRRFEPAAFTCRGGNADVLVGIAFRRADEGEAFAGRFGGRLSRAAALRPDSPAPEGMRRRLAG